MTTHNMKINVTDYGPIAQVKDIEIRPLTVFVGPSNTGKSYLAMLVYAFSKSLQVNRRWHHNFFQKMLKEIVEVKESQPDVYQEFIAFMDQIEPFNSIIPKLSATIKKEKKLPQIHMSDKLQKYLETASATTCAEMVGRQFREQFSHCMGVPYDGDNHFQGENFHFVITDGETNYTVNAEGVSVNLKIIPQLFVEKLEQELPYIRRHIIGIRRVGDEQANDEVKARLFVEALIDYISGLQPETNCYYLPAARTGIMQSWRVIASALVRRATLGGVEKISVPTLSGIVADYLGEIIELERRRSPDKEVAKIATQMEKNILHGAIKIEFDRATQSPQFHYEQKGLKIPLLSTSSMVSELAPVVLFLRYVVEQGDTLIIEEPEAHLHPAAQRKMAKTLVHLIRAGVRVIVTTHSDYFLEQLSNHVRQSKLKKPPASQFLKEEEIGVYAFSQQKKGTVVKALRFSNEDGLSSKDHDKVSSDLYNDTVKILDQIDNTK